MNKNLAVALNLDRPVIVFDLETTGLSVVHDRIVQMAYQKYCPDGTMTAETLIFNPQRPIPESASAVHGFTDEDVKDKPPFLEKAPELLQIFKDCYYSGFNIARYDLPLLKQEFNRSGLNFIFRPEDIIDGQLIYHVMEPRNLSAAYKFYCNKIHEEAHDAQGDVEATAEIIAEQIERYGKDEIKRIHEENVRDNLDLEGRFYREANDIYFAFSKFKGRTLQSVLETDPTFLRWILQADFPEDSKEVVRDFLKNI